MMANPVALAVFCLLVLHKEALGQIFNQPQPSFAIQPPPLQQQALANAQFSINTNNIVPDLPSHNSLAHRAVLINAEHEALLPAQLLNPFYKNPRISEALAKQSWPTSEETIVKDREAEKIPRQRIYYVLKSAGLVNRRRR